jgi:hypothetical protein
LKRTIARSILRAVTADAGWKLFSLSLAIALWAVSVAGPEVTTSMAVPIEFRNVPRDLELSSDLPDRITIELQGPAGNVSEFAMGRSPVILDLSSITQPGERTFTLGAANLDLPTGVRLNRAIPAQVRMVLEPRTTRDIPVDARFTGVPPGFRIAETSIVPPTVSVVGPRSRVEQLERAETDPIEIQAASGGADYRVQTFVGDPQVRFASSPIVSVRVTLEAAERD